MTDVVTRGRWRCGWRRGVCGVMDGGEGAVRIRFLKSKILSKRSGKSVDKFRGLEWSAPKSNPRGSGSPIVEGVGPKMQPAEMQAVPFRGLS